MVWIKSITVIIINIRPYLEINYITNITMCSWLKESWLADMYNYKIIFCKKKSYLTFQQWLDKLAVCSQFNRYDRTENNLIWTEIQLVAMSSWKHLSGFWETSCSVESFWLRAETVKSQVSVWVMERNTELQKKWRGVKIKPKCRCLF